MKESVDRYYFDCFCDGRAHADDHGIELPRREIPDQAREIIAVLLEERSRDAGADAFAVSVTARSGDGSTVYAIDAVCRGLPAR